MTVASSSPSPGSPLRPLQPRSGRSAVKRAQIVNVAMRHSAEHGVQASRIGDIADELGTAKRSIFQHFNSKNGLYVDLYSNAVPSLPAHLDPPSETHKK